MNGIGFSMYWSLLLQLQKYYLGTRVKKFFDATITSKVYAT